MKKKYVLKISKYKINKTILKNVRINLFKTIIKKILISKNMIQFLELKVKEHKIIKIHKKKKII
jgi:hypothetical protein